MNVQITNRVGLVNVIYQMVRERGLEFEVDITTGHFVSKMSAGRVSPSTWSIGFQQTVTHVYCCVG